MLPRLRNEVRAWLGDEEASGGEGGSPGRRWVRFWVRVVQGFVHNRCPSRASALAYSSLLAFIPLLALVIGISTSVLKNDADRIQGWVDKVLENVVPQLMKSEEFSDKKDEFVGHILAAIENVQSGTLGTTGTIGLLGMILFMLARIEETLNDIWGVARGRSWFARMVNYWAAITLGPILIAAALGFSTSLRLDQTQSWLRGGSSRVAPEDLRDPEAMLRRLQLGSDPASASVWRRFSPEAKQLLTSAPESVNPAAPTAAGEGPGPTASTDRRRTILARELTRIIQGGAIHDPVAFAEVALSPRTQEWLAKAPAGADLARWNRFLLEDVFPAELQRSPPGIPVFGSLLLWLVPIPILGGACALFYALMPNTRVGWIPALVGGGVAGVLWHLNNTLSVVLVTQAQVSQNRAIYNSLAAIPVFMVGLYLFWLLLLWGAQVAFTYQNRHRLAATRSADRVHQDGRELVAVRLMTEIARAYLMGRPPPSPATLAGQLEVPDPLVGTLASDLLQGRLLVKSAGAEVGFVPARPPSTIRIADILSILRRGTGQPLPTRDDPARSVVVAEMRRVAEAEAQAGTRTLEDLVRTVPSG